MGLWTDVKKETGYDTENDPAKREAILSYYLKRVQAAGFSIDDGVQTLTDLGVYEAEKKRREESAAHEMKVAEMHSPEWQRNAQQMVNNARDPLEVAEEAYRAAMKGEAPAAMTYRIPDKYLTDKELVDRYLAAKPTGDVAKDAILAQERRTDPLAAGFRSSVFGTAGISELPQDQQNIVRRAIAESAADIEAQRRDMNTGQKAISKAEEMAGTMLGSPSTYAIPLIPSAAALPAVEAAAPVVRGAVAGAKMLLSNPAVIYGAASGLESAAAQDNLGAEDVSYGKSAVKGALLGWVGGKIGEPVGEFFESVGARVSPSVAAAAGITGSAAGYGTVGSGLELAEGIHGKMTGKDQRSAGDLFSDVISGYGANMLTGVPQAILAHKAIEIKHRVFKGDMESALNMKDEAISHALDKMTSRYADIETAHDRAAELSNLPAVVKSSLPTAAIRGTRAERMESQPGMGRATESETSVKADAAAAEKRFDALDKEADRRRRNDTGSFARNLKGKALRIGTGIVDNKMMVLSNLWGMEKKERAAIVSEYAQRGMSRAETLDAMNKGIIPMPVARELAERIKEMPTEMQTMTHIANKIMAPVYYGMKASEARTFERYLMARNFLSAKERSRERGIEYKTPISERQLSAYVSSVEGSPKGPEMMKRAEYMYELSKQIVDLEYKGGIITADQRDRLHAVKDNIGISYLDPASEYRDSDASGKPTANASDMFNLLDKGGTWGMDTDVAGIMHQRLVRAQLEEYKNQTGKLLLSYAKEGKFDGSKLPTSEVGGHGEPVTAETPENVLGLRIVPEGESHWKGEDFIIVRDEGRPVKLAMPKWLKASLEADSEVTKAMIKCLGYFTMTSVVRKLAVQWNPEFAMANIPRDFARYYRLMAAADPHGWSASEMSAAKNFIAANPATYAAEMTKNIASVRMDATKKFMHEMENGEIAPYQGKDWYDRALKSNALRGVISRDVGSPLHKPGAAKTALHGVDVALGFCGEFSENLLRVAAFKTLVDRGFTDKRAGQIVGQFLDYNRHGTMSKGWDRIIPFFNVAIQAPRADIRTLRENPQAYIARLGWSAMAYTGIAMLTYSLDPEGKASKQTAARTRASNLIVPDPKPNADGSFRMVTVPLDQQDRLMAALCDTAVRAQHGLPIDKERLALSMRDFASINPEFYSYIPSISAWSALVLHTNVDAYRGKKLSYAPEGVSGKGEGTWHESYDPTVDSKLAIDLAQKLYPTVDWQPAAMTYAVSQLFPSSFFIKTAKTASAAIDPSADVKLSSIPMASRIIRDSDPKQPLRDAAVEGQIIKSEKDLDRYHEVRLESQVKDPDEYQNMMIQKIENAPVSEKKDILERFKEGFKDRIMGVDPETKFIQSQTDPSTWEELDKLHPMLDNPRVLKKFEKYKAGRNADNQQ